MPLPFAPPRVPDPQLPEAQLYPQRPGYFDEQNADPATRVQPVGLKIEMREAEDPDAAITRRFEELKLKLNTGPQGSNPQVPPEYVAPDREAPEERVGVQPPDPIEERFNQFKSKLSANPSIPDQDVAFSFRELTQGMANHVANIILAPMMPFDLGQPVAGSGPGAMLHRAAAAHLGPDQLADDLFRTIAKNYFDQPDRPMTETVSDWLDKKGITHQGLDTWSAQMGEETVNGMLQLIGIGTAAHMLTAGKYTVPFIMRQMTEWMARNPLIAMSEATGAAAGTVLARRAVKGSDASVLGIPMGPTIELLGGAAGGLGATSLGAATRGVGKAVGRGIANAGRATVGRVAGAIAPDTSARLGQFLEKAGVLRPKPPLQAEPLRDENVIPDRIKGYAEIQIEADRMAQQKALDAAFERIPVKATQEQANRILHKGVIDAEKTSQHLVNRAWQRADLQQPVPLQKLQQRIGALVKEYKGREEALPQKQVEFLLQRDPATAKGLRWGKNVMNPVGFEGHGADKVYTGEASIQQLLSLKSNLSANRVAELSKVFSSKAANKSLARTYAVMEGIIDDAIVEAYPNNVKLQQARALSKQHHELFDPDAIMGLLAKKQSGQLKVSPTKTAKSIISQPEGVQNVQDISKTLRSGPLSSTFKGQPGHLTIEQRQRISQLQPQLEDAIMADIKETGLSKVPGLGPDAAIRKMDSLMPKVRGLGNASSELQVSYEDAIAAVEQGKQINRSVLAKVAEVEDPSVAMRRIFSAPDPAKAVTELQASFNNVPEAGEALAQGMLDEFVTRANFDPLRMDKMLKNPAIRKAMRAALTPPVGPKGYSSVQQAQAAARGSKFERLERMVRVAKSVAGGDEVSLRKYGQYNPGSIMFRILGASFGRKVSHIMGGSTIQIPAIFSGAAGRSFERIFRGTKPEELFKMAVFDPKWERLLLAREPHSTKEMRALAWKMRFTIVGAEAGRQALAPSEE